MFCVALASLVLATSCSQDDLQTAKFSQNPINLNAGLGSQPISSKAVKSRAVETTITNLGSFTMNAFQDGETNYMKDVKYTSTDGSVWNTDAGTFYWPVEGNLHFYAYAPEQPGQAGTFKLDKDAQTLTDFVPNTAAADQKDFVYAKSTGNNKANGTTGIDIDFQQDREKTADRHIAVTFQAREQGNVSRFHGIGRETSCRPKFTAEERRMLHSLLGVCDKRREN